MSKFDNPYKSVNVYLPVRLIAAMDRIAERYPNMNRSRVAEIVISNDLEVRGALAEIEAENEKATEALNDDIREND